jgi:heme/copper-type cytochrome/quinol oxidase subunit 3
VVGGLVIRGSSGGGQPAGLLPVGALGVLVYAWLQLQEDRLEPGVFAAAEVFWYFVVGVWPMIYLRVYL